MLKAKLFMKWVVETALPRKMRALREPIEEKDTQLEEKDAHIALRNDDLQDREHDLQEREYDLQEWERDIAALEEELEVQRRRFVPVLKDDYKNPSMAIYQKNNGDDHPYVSICGQQGYVTQKIQDKLAEHLNGQIVVFSETLNAIVHYNWLRERGLIVLNPALVKHFRLGDNYTHQQLEEMQE